MTSAIEVITSKIRKNHNMNAGAAMGLGDSVGSRVAGGRHRWEIPLLCYRKIMIISLTLFLVLMTRLLSCIIVINDLYVHYLVHLDDIYSRSYMLYKTNSVNNKSPDSLNVMVNYHYHGENRVTNRYFSSMVGGRADMIPSIE